MIRKLSFKIYLAIFVVVVSMAAPVVATADDETDIVLENLTPIPLNPVNNEMDVPVTPVNFTWKGVVGAVRYKIECYDSDFNLIFSADTVSSATGHVYRGTLKYNTTYNWRIIPTDPPGDWSAVSWFTTEKQSSAAGNSTEEGEGSTIGSMKGPSAVMIIAIVIGVLAVILIIAYFALPKKRPFPGFNAGQPQGFGGMFKNITSHFQSPQQGYVPPPFRCPNCGAENRPGQQFCWDCGSKLPLPPPPPPPPRPQWNAPNQPHPGRPGVQLCPRCGDMVTPGERFCGTCGANVAGIPAPREQQTGYRGQAPQASPIYGDPTPHAAPPPPDYGAPPPPTPSQPPNWQQHYGQQTAQDYPCPGCGTMIPYGEKACPLCGTQIQW